LLGPLYQEGWRAATGCVDRASTNSKQADLSVRGLLQEAVVVEPVRERFEPELRRVAGIAHAEAVAAVLVEVEFHRLFGVIPRLDQAELAVEEEIVHRDRREQRRRVLRHLDGAHATVDRGDEG